MKILVADDDQASRRLVAAFLSRADYETVAVESGEEALAAMLQPEPPAIAIIDWVMPGLTGPEVVTRLRNASFRVRPYVILLSAKNDKASVAEGLDAGADDFLTKPFNPLEMLARVRVAERTLQVQLELQQHIAELEALAQRYNLLGELIGRPHTLRAPEPAQEAAVTRPGPAPAPRPSSTRLRPDEIDAITRRALAEVGLESCEPVPLENLPTDVSGPHLLAWAGLVLVQEKCWVDLLLEVDVDGAAGIHATALRRPPASPQEARRFLAEVHTILVSTLRAELKSRAADILSPGMSRAIERAAGVPPLPLPEDRARRAYAAGPAVLTLTIARHPCPILQKDPRELKAGEITATDFPPPEIDSIPLVTRGSVVNERIIGKLIAHAQREGNRLGVPVFSPSALATRV